MTELEELYEITRRRIRHKKLYIFAIIPIFVFAFLPGWYFPLTGIMCWLCIGVGLSVWAGKFKTFQCPNDARVLKYDKDVNRFYCENCGIIELPLPSFQEPASAPLNISFEEGEIVGTCVVCNLPVFELEEQLSCPVCFSPAHENHLLEWIKIKGYCPYCKTNLNLNRIRNAFNTAPELVDQGVENELRTN